MQRPLDSSARSESSSAGERVVLKRVASRHEYRYKVSDRAQKRLSYLIDWGFVFLLIFFSITVDSVPGFKKYISEGEIWMYSYPLKSNSFPSWALLPGCLGFPMFIILVCHLFVKRTRGSALHHAMLGLFMSVALTLFLTTTVKLMVGRPRPDFFARCFGGEIPAANDIPWESEGYPACTGDPAVIAEGRKSFPSGHSSLAFSGLMYLTLYLSGFLDTFDEEGHPWKLFLCSLPALAAMYIAVSRVSDYWHHTTDVLAGSILGTVVAYLSYKQQHFKSHFEPTAEAEGEHTPLRSFSQRSAPAEYKLVQDFGFEP